MTQSAGRGLSFRFAIKCFVCFRATFSVNAWRERRRLDRAEHVPRIDSKLEQIPHWRRRRRYCFASELIKFSQLCPVCSMLSQNSFYFIFSNRNSFLDFLSRAIPWLPVLGTVSRFNKMNIDAVPNPILGTTTIDRNKQRTNTLQMKYECTQSRLLSKRAVMQQIRPLRSKVKFSLLTHSAHRSHIQRNSWFYSILFDRKKKNALNATYWTRFSFTHFCVRISYTYKYSVLRFVALRLQFHHVFYQYFCMTTQ